jgi:hypothetical protein
MEKAPMRQLNKEELRSLLEKSSQELHRKIDCHYARILCMLDGTAGGAEAEATEPLPAFRREDKLKAAFIETIEVLEQTRKSFKSKQIEALRRKLTQVLIDAE